ncbi:helix-turn-helix transcriptional regulator [Polaribacter sp. Z014]|uniref:helix-turn-helix domain-containing protein n=1 Tax=Polaribacter sp. Z014 TaxID=2927126 RepID=UPI0020212B05|nr:helix-turn-helix transcriptional regulator [Polaribacter sp. Z014]MCL7764601.1 helix-turn-helix transcriptional regulator [Polaribacter sp. Z014]
MVNISEFTTRLKKVMEFHQLSASMFADKIGVQRSSISHILSGRNKPSLDFILKVTTEFNDVDMYWLLNGKGSFPKNVENKIEPKLTSTGTPTLFNDTSSSEAVGKKIQRIVVFYSDGTFEEYQK